MTEKTRIHLQLREKNLKKINELVEAGTYSSRSDFFRRAVARELNIVRRRKIAQNSNGKKRVTWRDLDDAALDGLAELAKRARKKRKN